MTLPIENKNVQALHYQLTHKNMKTIAFVGVTPKVGTTSIAYAMARRFAASGAKTLLIDLERIGHSISSQLACSQGDWNPETVRGSGAIIPMGRTGLSVLSAPLSKSLHWSFKEQGSIQKMLRDFRKEYDVIILDAGSVMTKQDRSIPAEVVASAADVCAPVILSGKTNEIDISKSQKILEAQGVNLQGFVMNDYQNPPLSEELERTLKRFEKLSPKCVGWGMRVLRNKAFLSQVL